MKRILWFTGLSGSGKTTIALQLQQKFIQNGEKVLVLDGDVIREKLHKHLGFNREDIRENNRLIAELARKEAAYYDVILVPIISPFREDREKARQIIGEEFAEVFINAPLEECIKRDVKQLYKKALQGEIQNFIGIAASNPYEPPLDPDLEIKTNEETIEESVKKVQDFLNEG